MERLPALGSQIKHLCPQHKNNSYPKTNITVAWQAKFALSYHVSGWSWMSGIRHLCPADPHACEYQALQTFCAKSGPNDERARRSTCHWRLCHKKHECKHSPLDSSKFKQSYACQSFQFLSIANGSLMLFLAVLPPLFCMVFKKVLHKTDVMARPSCLVELRISTFIQAWGPSQLLILSLLSMSSSFLSRVGCSILNVKTSLEQIWTSIHKYTLELDKLLFHVSYID